MSSFRDLGLEAGCSNWVEFGVVSLGEQEVSSSGRILGNQKDIPY